MKGTEGCGRGGKVLRNDLHTVTQNSHLLQENLMLDFEPAFLSHPAHRAHALSRAYLGSQSQVLLLQLSEFVLQDIQLQWIVGDRERLVETQRCGTAGIRLALLRSDGNNTQQVILL